MWLTMRQFVVYNETLIVCSITIAVVIESIFWSIIENIPTNIMYFKEKLETL